MADRSIRLGVIVPSSNTAMEPLINNMVDALNLRMPSIHITVHYSRFRVTQISLDAEAGSQFDLPEMMQAASLLADAKVDAIAWGGTSAGWLGLERDHKLCSEISSQFGVPATTSTLALVELIHLLDDPIVGLITPYIPEMNSTIRKTFASVGITIGEEDQSLSITENHAIGKVAGEKLASMLDHVLNEAREINTIMVFCTNLGAAHLAAAWEKANEDRNLIVLDSVSAVVWGLMRRLGLSTVGTGVAKDWGLMFDEIAQSA